MSVNPNSLGGPGAGIGRTEADLRYGGLGDPIIGEQTYPRTGGLLDYNNNGVSGFQFLNYFTAHSDVTVTQAKFETGSQANSGVTLVRVGLWTVDPSSLGLTLVASTANDTTLGNTAYTGYPKALQSPYTFIEGQRYAAGILQVASTVAFFMGPYTIQRVSVSPRQSAIQAAGGLSDLFSTATDASLQDYRYGQYVAFTP